MNNATSGYLRRGPGVSLSGGVIAEESRLPYVRIAELEIDPAQLEATRRRSRKRWRLPSVSSRAS